MAERDKPESSGLELDLSSRTPPASASTSGPRSSARTSDPRMQAARSASRLDAVPEAPKQLTSKRLKEGAVDTLFNSATILADVIDDFRSSDRFFKYKALVLGTWMLLAVSAFGVACPGQGPSNDIGAQLVVGGEATKPIYMVKNESQDVWQDVEVLVNGQYRSTMGQVEANGGSITLSSAVLYDDKGTKAPATLQISDISVHVTEPAGDATLLEGGVPVK